MCGIAGLVAAPETAVERQTVQRMCDVMTYRGPDDEGLHISGNVGFGMRRLSIIDLHSGHQPIHNEDKTVWVVLNGEIYNYRELREQMLEVGHEFYTQSDTEVIVHLYEEYGDRFVEHLSGMFSIALHDQRKKRVLLARDRIGEKQLYYSTTSAGLVFGSEIKCLLSTKLVDTRIDYGALDQYFRYLYVPAPGTAFRNVRELPPATLLVLENDAAPIEHRYWQLRSRDVGIRNENEAVEAVREQILTSVQSRLVSDVPIGALLSGGIDSSAVVAAMVANGSTRAKTYTIGYSGAKSVYDERDDARAIASHLGTDHTEIEIDPDVEDLVPKLVRAFDQPFADSSAIANYYVFGATSDHVKVVLSGLGGDELFGGYERYLAIRRHMSLSWIPGRHLFTGIARRLPEQRSGGRFVDRVKRFSAALGLPPAEAYQSYVTSFDDAARATLFTAEARKCIDDERRDDPFTEIFSEFGAADPVAAAMATDILTYLPGDLLTLTDRTSMQHSIEARAPLIDYELIELAMAIPSSVRIRGSEKKRILREAVRPFIPSKILDRPKRGFTVPLTNWFRDELQSYIRQELSESRLKRSAIFNPAAVTRLVDDHVARRANNHARLWALLMFVNWFDEYA